jgi:UTP-glucose-1-phosphate uridylyltransferase
VTDLYEKRQVNVVAVVKITAEEAARRGPTAVYPGELVGNEFRISAIPSKGEKTSTFDTHGAAAAYTAVGRFVFEPETFAVIDEVERSLAPGQELDDVPVMQSLLRKNEITGRLIDGDFFDVGLIDGFREADAAFS